MSLFWGISLRKGDIQMRELSMEELEQVVGGRTLTVEDVTDYYCRTRDLRDDVAKAVEGNVRIALNDMEIFCWSGITGACLVRNLQTSQIQAYDDVEDAIEDRIGGHYLS